jgi:hypothetical protein
LVDFQPVAVGLEPAPHLSVFMIRGVVLNENGPMAAIMRGQAMEEIRLACPSESAGSVYTVGLEGEPTLTATVEATGDWTQFSGWRALGTLHIPAGRHTLAVRIVSMPAYAAMNLASVRLVPLS